MARALGKSDRQQPLGCYEASADAPWADGALCDLTLYVPPAGGGGSVTDAATAMVERRLAGEQADFLTAEQAKELAQPDAGAVEEVVRALRDRGIEHAHPVGWRAVHVQARWAQLADLVLIERMRFRTPDGLLVGRIGPIELSDGFLDPVVAVFGLDNRRALSSYVIKSHVIKSHVIKSHVIKSHVIKSHVIKSHVIKSHVIKSHGDLRAELQTELDDPEREWFPPDEIAARYRFPQEATGDGVRIGVLAFSGNLGGTDQLVMGGFHEEELRTFWRDELGQKSSPTIETHVVRGPGNWPSDGSAGGDQGADFTDEVMLDLSVIGALAPESNISVWFSEPTEQGFVDALHAIVEEDEPPDVLVICYGAPEDKGLGTSWTGMAIEQADLAFALAALRGITVVVSCGDNGAAGMPLSTRVHADYPASSPWVLGVGGTTARRHETGAGSETVWNDGLGASGGGISAITQRPAWQDSADVPEPVDAWSLPAGFRGRGVPDVAAVADLTTGVAVVDAAGDTVRGGGTSVSAPVWAALLARVREQVGRRLGFVAPQLYKRGEGYSDVPIGDNGAYPAKDGAWDPCTGLGIPDGSTLHKVM